LFWIRVEDHELYFQHDLFQIVFLRKLTNSVFISVSLIGDFSFDVIWDGISIFIESFKGDFNPSQDLAIIAFDTDGEYTFVGGVHSVLDGILLTE
jgi:hypothetical protein